MLEWYDFETVLDPYSGSGATARAAKEMGKHFLAFEIDPAFHAKSVIRLNQKLVDKKITGPLFGDAQENRP